MASRRTIAKSIGVTKFITHSFKAASIAIRNGWLPGARYSNLRDVRKFDRLGFLDINWKDYNFRLHLAAAKATRPQITVARDVDKLSQLDRTLDEANELALWADRVIVVPKDRRFKGRIDELIPGQFVLGYSVPTRYGSTALPPSAFDHRAVHLLGGRPDLQRSLAATMLVKSFDCNRFTLDAAFGDYFDGETFRPHPIGGYERCLEDSVHNINALWEGYKAKV